FEHFVRAICELLNFGGQRAVADPEIRRGVVIQNLVDFPAAWSRRAFSASASSLPAATSCSSWRSQTSQSYVRNHLRNAASSSGERSLISRSSFSTSPMTAPLQRPEAV